MIFIGYELDIKGYKVYDMDSRKVWVEREVLFDEWIFLFKPKRTSKTTTTEQDNEEYEQYIPAPRIAGYNVQGGPYALPPYWSNLFNYGHPTPPNIPAQQNQMHAQAQAQCGKPVSSHYSLLKVQTRLCINHNDDLW
ncbi:hypothetical protein FRC03_009911 [Tulasnella sp. 419]|nr:hypothetical protein FRC03_009911 [Tulasnella sp. 419]